MLENKNIVVKSYNGLKYMQFKKLLEFGIVNAYTLKSDGFDFSHNVKEEKNSYEILAEALKIDSDRFVKPVQTHTSNVFCIDEIQNDLSDVDGLITNKKDIILTSKNADCILFLFYDPVKKVIANVHSGWKGTFKKISEKTIVKMISNYGCDPKDIYIFISPCIRKCHFEVDEEVKKLCENIFEYTNRTNEFIEQGRIVDGIQKYNIDTIKINKILFEELGIDSEKIIDSEICSVCNKDYIHSARMEKENFKRATAIISL